MKHNENSFAENIKSIRTYNLHKKNDISKKYADTTIDKMNNIIIHGANGIGKYTQALSLIHLFSPSNLNYEKNVFITTSLKNDYNIKISDIHFEVDMDLLGCNAKALWYDIYKHIIDIILTSKRKQGIILCKNYQNIHNELLDIMYCYMNEIHHNIDVKFVLITNNINFIPRNILDVVDVFSLYRPSRRDYEKVVGEKLTVNTYNIKNIKTLKKHKENIITFENIADNLYNIVIVDIKTNKFDLLDLRDKLYNILLYHQDIYECFFYILDKLFKEKYIERDDFIKINVKLIEFAKLFNNNYRPIFHLERFSLYLNSVIHKYEL